MIKQLDETETLEIPEGHNVLVEMNSNGDTKLIWDPNNPVDVEAARAAWDAAKKKGATAYAVADKEGAKGEVLHGPFDPSKRRVILTPPVVGG